MICNRKKSDKSRFHYWTDFLSQDTVQNDTCLENLQVKKKVIHSVATKRLAKPTWSFPKSLLFTNLS